MAETTALQTREETTAAVGAFANMENFQSVQRMAKLLCASELVPEQYRGETKLANCVIALEIAQRLGASPLPIMQNLYIVHGRPAWSSQFLISCVNASGRFSPLRYAMAGEADKDNRTCIAWATDKSGERLESPPVSIAMAKTEGWFSKNGSKWKTMPELMLRYRAATLFARLYAPELTMGMQCEEEVIDIAPVVTDPIAPPKDHRSAGAILSAKLAAAKDVTPTVSAQDAKKGPEYPAVAALANAGISLAQAEAYYRACDELKDNEPLLCLSDATMDSITADTAAVAARIKAWAAKQ